MTSLKNLKKRIVFGLLLFLVTLAWAGSFTTDNLRVTTSIQLDSATVSTLTSFDATKKLVSYAGSSCAAHTATTSIAASGAATCTTFIDTAGSGLSASGSTLNLNIAGASCAAGQAVTAISSTGVGSCGTAGITNSAGNNVIMKSDGTNAVASGLTDNGTTVSTSENISQSGSTFVQTGTSGVQINSQGSTNDLPSVVSYHGNPNTNVTANRGSLALDGLNNAAWINTDSASAWTQLSTGAVTPSTIGTEWGGPGTDGAVTFDGAATVCGAAPAANVYTLARDCRPTSATVNNGVTVALSGYRLLVTGTLTHNGTISHNGGNASGKTAGASAGTGYVLFSSTAGGTGGDGGVGGGGQNSSQAIVEYTDQGNAGCAANGGGTSAGGGGGAGAFTCGSGGSVTHVGSSTTYGSTTFPDLYRGFIMRAGTTAWDKFSSGSGGGGGGSSCSTLGVGQGGGGGGGGGWAVVSSRVVTGNGAIQAKGGNGANAQVPGAPCVGNNGGGGGGGGGGTIVWIYTTNTGTVTTSVAGGTHGTGANAGGNGGDGVAGTVYKFNLSGDGT